MNTAVNSSPLAAWTVINCTLPGPPAPGCRPLRATHATGSRERRHRVGVLRRVGDDPRIEDDGVGIVGSGHQFGRGRRTRTQRNGARGRIEAVAFFADEGRGRVDQFLQVFEAVLAFALGLVKLGETARAHDVFDRFRQAHLLRFRAHLRRSDWRKLPRLEPALPVTYGIAAAIEQL